MSENQKDQQTAEKKEEDVKVDAENKPPPVARLPDPFTCFIKACPEPRNAEFKAPEFLVCYKCPFTTDDPDGQTKYFCYPIMGNSYINPNDAVLERYTPKAQTDSTTSEDSDKEDVPRFFQFPQWYSMNQGFHNCCQPTYHQCPQYMHQQQQQQQQQQPQQQFYPSAPTYGYRNFDGNFYFYNGAPASQNV